MVELAPKELLQPALLDRLTDDERDKSVEPVEKRVVSMRRLRQSVLRDLTWLLNTGNLAMVQDLTAYPYVAGSVINYGLRDLAGATASSLDAPGLENAVRQAIVAFEPRILPNTVTVRAVLAKDQMNRNALGFEIEGELWGQPAPVSLYIRTEVDLDTGHVTVAN